MASGKGRTPAVTDLGDKWIEMLHGQRKGRTPAATDLGDIRIEMLHGQRKGADTSSDRPGRQMNRNATWPAVKGGHQQWHKGRTHFEKELRTPNSKLFGEIYMYIFITTRNICYFTFNYISLHCNPSHHTTPHYITLHTLIPSHCTYIYTCVRINILYID